MTRRGGQPVVTRRSHVRLTIAHDRPGMTPQWISIAILVALGVALLIWNVVVFGLVLALLRR